MAIIVVTVVVVLVIVAVIAVSVIHAGTLDVTIRSDHVSQTVAVTVTVSGNSVWTGSLAPGGTTTQPIPETWTSGNCQTFTVVATSTGGGFGTQTDQATPTVCSGGSAPVTLTV